MKRIKLFHEIILFNQEYYNKSNKFKLLLIDILFRTDIINNKSIVDDPIFTKIINSHDSLKSILDQYIQMPASRGSGQFTLHLEGQFTLHLEGQFTLHLKGQFTLHLESQWIQCLILYT